MRRWLLTLVFLLSFASAALPQWQIDGGPTDNVYKVLPSSGGPYSTVPLAVRAAQSKGAAEIVFGPGIYPFTGVAVIDHANVTLTIESGATLYVSNTSSVSVFDVTAQNVKIVGRGTIEVPSVTASQIAVRVTGDDFVIDGVRFNCSSSAASANTLTAASKFLNIDSANSYIVNCTFNPNKGILCVDVPDSGKRRTTIDSCNFSTDNTTGITSGSVISPRKAVGALRMKGHGWSIVNNCVFYGLGDATDPCTFVIRLQRSWGVPETGHTDFTNNRVEANNCPRVLDLWGCSSQKVMNNTFGFPTDSITSTGGTIILTTLDPTGTDPDNILGIATYAVPGAECAGVTIEGNDIHNFIEADGSAGIRIDSASVVSINGNNFNTIGVDGVGNVCFGILLVTTQANHKLDALNIFNNNFDGSAGSSICVGRNSTSLGIATNGLYVADNTWRGLSAFTNLGDPDGAGALTAITMGSGTLYTDQTITKVATTLAAAAAGNAIVDSANGLAGFRAGDIMDIAGFTGTAANNQKAVVAAVAAGTLNVITPTAFVNDAEGESVTLTVTRTLNFAR